MKKVLISIILSVVIIMISGCGKNITLDNIDTMENEFEYSTIGINGELRETEETKVVQEAKEFTKKFISKQLTRTYKEELNIEDELLIFSEEYKEKNGEKIKELIEFTNEFYKTYGITTEVQNANFKKVVNINGDAYVEVVAKVRLIECSDLKVSELIGYKDGLNSNIPCEFKIKMKYIDSEYYVYDYVITEKEGYLSSMINYKDIGDKLYTFGIENEDEIKEVVRKVAIAQNDRDYKNFKGDEDYPYLSESYKAELNKDRDDVATTKSVYEKFKINTSFISLQYKSMKMVKDKCVVTLEIKTKLNECINDEVAKNIHFTNGIGSETVVLYEYIVGKENGEFKIFSTKEI